MGKPNSTRNEELITRTMSVAKTNILPSNPLINPKKLPLTPNVLRTFSGCENFSEKETEEIVYSLKLFASILVEFEKEMRNKNIDV